MGILYIYDSTNNLYKENINEINTYLRDIRLQYHITNNLSAIIKETEYHIKSMGNHTEYPFNNSSDTFPVINGVIRINYTTNEITRLNHGPEHLFTYKLNASYNVDIPQCLTRNVFVAWVDEEIVDALIQIPAQAILQMQTGLTYKKAHMLQGERNAGKSSYFELLMKFFTEKYYSQVKLQQLCGDKFTSGSMEGKLINIYDDLEDLELKSIDTFKTYTGSCRHRIERKRQDGYTGKISAVNVFSCNYPPSYPETVMRDAAFWARWEYVIFRNFFAINPNWMSETYTEEFMSSFLNVIIDGMIRIKNKGSLLIDSEIVDVMHRWSLNSDPLYEFIQTYFISNNSKILYKIGKDETFKLYSEYCELNNTPMHKRIIGTKTLTISLQKMGFLPDRKTVNKINHEVYATTQYMLTHDTNIITQEKKDMLELKTTSTIKTNETLFN